MLSLWNMSSHQYNRIKKLRAKYEHVKEIKESKDDLDVEDDKIDDDEWLKVYIIPTGETRQTACNEYLQKP